MTLPLDARFCRICGTRAESLQPKAPHSSATLAWVTGLVVWIACNVLMAVAMAEKWRGLASGCAMLVALGYYVGLFGGIAHLIKRKKPPA